VSSLELGNSLKTFFKLGASNAARVCDKFEITVNSSILIKFSIMTTIMKCHSHSAPIAIDLAAIWALCQKIYAQDGGAANQLLTKWISWTYVPLQ
jgi:hypothetical protein